MQVQILLLTGPPAAGRRAVAEEIARHTARCAVIDVDILRAMVRQPRRAPSEGLEGYAQQMLGIHNAALLARSFWTAGFRVVLVDAISEESAAYYHELLGDLEPAVVLLLPSLEEVTRRAHERGLQLEAGLLEALYRQQQQFVSYDWMFDPATTPATELADQLVTWLGWRPA